MARPYLVDAHCHLGDGAFDPGGAAVLERARPAGVGTIVVLHSFSSGPKVFEAGMSIGAYFSFSGMITFRNWNPTVRLSDCPADRLLVETDAPYLAPVPHRGRRNEPGFAREVAEALARARGEPLEAVGPRTTENARRLFGPR